MGAIGTRTIINVMVTSDIKSIRLGLALPRPEALPEEGAGHEENLLESTIAR